ncbi:MAG TPA: MFS transporter [bacterium]|nr:MFS transporter [bacterium]
MTSTDSQGDTAPADTPAPASAGPPTPPARTGAPSFVRALQHRNYRLFFTGQLISLIGTWMQSVAQAWLVYRLTGSELLLGLVTFCQQIPVFLLAAVGGTVADRVSRRGIMVCTQSIAMVQALVLAVQTLTHTVQVWEIFLLALVLGLVNSFDVPSRQALSVDMVGKADLQNAIALNSSIFNGARMVGPAIAGLLVAAVGEGWCFFLNGVSYVAVIAGLLMMRLKPGAVARRKASILENVREGVRYIRQTQPVAMLLLMLGVASLMGMPYQVLMPIFAQGVLHSGPSGLGLLMSCAGVGALGAAISLATRLQVRGLEVWIGRAAVSFGLALIAFALSRWLWLSCLLLVGVGYSMMTQMASSNTLIQVMVPDHLRGRVMAAYSMMLMGMAPFGALLAGALAQHIGTPMTVALGGGLCMLSGLAFRRRLARFRSQSGALLAPEPSAAD